MHRREGGNSSLDNIFILVLQVHLKQNVAKYICKTYKNRSSKPLFSPSRLSVRSFGVTLQHFIPLIAPEAPTALVPGAPEPRIYPHSR